jgi:NAD(P)-dependent dehydrogenase (short-subunit alcohol dehydrogenase family)
VRDAGHGADPTTLVPPRTLLSLAVMGLTAMSNRFEDVAAVVTGGASGNGRAIATRLASEGASVTIADVREDPRLGGTPTHERISQRGGEAQFVECDVQSIEEIRDAVARTVDAFGSLDVMVNNAGIDRKIPVEDVSLDDFESLCDINLNGVYFGCQAAIDVMRDQPEGGCIINISSIAGSYGFADTSMYCATKGGVTNLTRALAVEVAADGIRVNAISPGIIETAATVEDEDTVEEFADDVPLGRIGQPEDVGNVAAFLASEDASYVTGHNLVVDGGIVASPT